MNILILIFSVVMTCIISSGLLIGGGKNVISFFDKNYTTVAKGIAILFIMISHCSSLWNGGRLLTPCGGIGVAIFLITSGYGLNESYKKSGLKAFWKKRLGRVYFPYFVAIIIFAIIRGWNFEKWLVGLLCIYNPYWFITYIIECYIAFWLTAKLIPAYRIILMLGLSLLTICFMPELQAEQAFSFLIGVILSDNREKFNKFRMDDRLYLMACISLLFIGLVFLAFKQTPAVRVMSGMVAMNIVQCLIKCPLGLFVLFSISCFKKIQANQFLYFSGMISYELYLVHFPFYTFIGNRLWPVFILFLGSFVTAYVFYKMNNFAYKKIFQ